MTPAFHITRARWASDREALRHVREQVFVIGQQVPVELEWDGLDAECAHVLAWDTDNRPIGTARMTPDRRIGRMAVLEPWRGQGVGAALLVALLDLARSRHWMDISLHAQVHALGFYRQHGFAGEGAEFDEAGIRHRLMRKSLDGSDAGQSTLECGNRDASLHAVLRLLAGTTRTCRLHTRDLMPEVLDNATVQAALRKLAESSRHATLHCLLLDPDSVQRKGHRLLDLAWRLPSFIEWRTPERPEDLACREAWLLDDHAGYLHWPHEDAPSAHGRMLDGPRHRELQRRFDQIWERAVPATCLRQLAL